MVQCSSVNILLKVIDISFLSRIEHWRLMCHFQIRDHNRCSLKILSWLANTVPEVLKYTNGSVKLTFSGQTLCLRVKSETSNQSGDQRKAMNFKIFSLVRKIPPRRLSRCHMCLGHVTIPAFWIIKNGGPPQSTTPAVTCKFSVAYVLNDTKITVSSFLFRSISIIKRYSFGKVIKLLNKYYTPL